MDNDSAEERVRQNFDWQEVSPCFAVIETIELYDKTYGTSSSLEQPLGTYFDVDALDNLLPNELRMKISFDVEDYTVTIQETSVSVTAGSSGPLPNR